jgi:multicomponent Na+:H+ antiporter subunit D
MNLLVVLPILSALLFGILSLFAWGRVNFQRYLSLVGTVAHLVVSAALLQSVRAQGIQVMQLGNWPAPFGISLVIDLFSAVMLVMTGIMGVLIALFAFASIDSGRIRYGFYPLFFLLIMGVSGSFSTGDLFNLYVWFEVMLMASFVLMAMGGTRAQMEGSTKYVVMNLMGSILFLMAIAVSYTQAGTLNMADMAVQLAAQNQPGLTAVLAVLYLSAFGIKAAIFPFFFWLPASYHTPPVVITALFSGLLTKVGVYSLVRVFTLIFTGDPGFTQPLLLILAGLTMVIGVLGAAAQWDLRRLLAFHIISQIGYLLMGLGLFTEMALAGTVFFMIHVIFAKTALFLVAGIIHNLVGTFNLKKVGGLYRAYPLLTLMFAFPALSLAGLPPFSGFFAKLILVTAGLSITDAGPGPYIIVAVSLVVSLLTLFSMSKIWVEGFWTPAATEHTRNPVTGWHWAPVILLSIAVIVLGSQPFFEISQQAAAQLMDRTLYIEAVLGAMP